MKNCCWERREGDKIINLDFFPLFLDHPPNIFSSRRRHPETKVLSEFIFLAIIQKNKNEEREEKRKEKEKVLNTINYQTLLFV